MNSSSGGKESATRSSLKNKKKRRPGGSRRLSGTPDLTDYSTEPSLAEKLSKQTVSEEFLPTEVLPALPTSMSYVPVTKEEPARAPIVLKSVEDLASFALSLSPGKLSRADLEAMRLLLVAQASAGGNLKEVNAALGGLEKLIEPKQAKQTTVTNNTVILGALDRVRKRQGLIEE